VAVLFCALWCAGCRVSFIVSTIIFVLCFFPSSVFYSSCPRGFYGLVGRLEFAVVRLGGRIYFFEGESSEECFEEAVHLGKDREQVSDHDIH
jgi:hypothetical protein